jgi:hypothetical protein
MAEKKGAATKIKTYQKEVVLIIRHKEIFLPPHQLISWKRT